MCGTGGPWPRNAWKIGIGRSSRIAAHRSWKPGRNATSQNCKLRIPEQLRAVSEDGGSKIVEGLYRRSRRIRLGLQHDRGTAPIKTALATRFVPWRPICPMATHITGDLSTSGRVTDMNRILVLSQFEFRLLILLRPLSSAACYACSSGHTSTTPCATAHGVRDTLSMASAKVAASIMVKPATGNEDVMNGPFVVST
jgi:hypothetical protein